MKLLLNINQRENCMLTMGSYGRGGQISSPGIQDTHVWFVRKPRDYQRLICLMR